MISRELAEQIAQLITENNNLPKPVCPDKIYEEDYFYIGINKGKVCEPLIACVCAKRLSFFAYELKHLSVNTKFRKKGYGRMMVESVIDFVKSKQVTNIFATVLPSNICCLNLLQDYGFKINSKFPNIASGHECILLQKMIELPHHQLELEIKEEKKSQPSLKKGFMPRYKFRNSSTLKYYSEEEKETVTSSADKIEIKLDTYTY